MAKALLEAKGWHDLMYINWKISLYCGKVMDCGQERDEGKE